MLPDLILAALSAFSIGTPPARCAGHLQFRPSSCELFEARMSAMLFRTAVLKSAMRFKTDIRRRLPTNSIYEYTPYRMDARIAGGS